MWDSSSKITNQLHGGDKKVKLGILVSATGIGVFLSSLDQTIVNVSLPAMRISLNTTQQDIQWVIIVYLLTMIAFTASAGNLGDRISNKNIFQTGMLLFALGSLSCFFSKTLVWLVMSRLVQAIGGSGMIANGIAIIARFTDNTNRGTAIGINSFIIAIGVVSGPVLGGVLTEHLGWHYIFLINVPLGLLGLIWVQFAIPQTEPLEGGKRKGDPIGSFTFAGFLTLLVFGLTILTDKIVKNSIVYGILCFGTSAILFGFFIWWEKPKSDAMIDLSLFKERRYSIGIFSAVFAYIGLCVIIFQLPFYLHDILHYTPTQIGEIVLITAVTMAIGSLIFGKLSNFINAKILTTSGLGIMVLALMVGAKFLTDHTPMWLLGIIAFLIGLALGCFVSPNSNDVMAVVPKGKEGVSNALVGLATNVGFSLGTGLATAIFSANLNTIIRLYGGTATDTFNYVKATKWLLWSFAVICLFAAILSFFRDFEKKNNRKKKND
ncbi:MAG: MFS transporter [Candidatus Heimdallarchaeaceae archaeon]